MANDSRKTGETKVTRETDRETKTEVSRNKDDRSETSGSGQKTAGSLKEAIYGNADAEAAAAEEQTNARDEAYMSAAQAELDAQQKARDEGYATDATEGPAKAPVAEDDDASAKPGADA